jgi:hypothetical protein
VLYFTLVYHLTNLYGAKNIGPRELHPDQRRHLHHAVLGRLGPDRRSAPAGHHLSPRAQQGPELDRAACGLVIVGGLAAMYVIIIGSQAFPQEMFPGQTVLSFGAPGDVGGAVAPYAPSFPELLLGIGGVGVAMLIVAVGIRVLQFLPESLADRTSTACSRRRTPVERPPDPSREPTARLLADAPVASGRARAFRAPAVAAMPHLYLAATHKSSGKTTAQHRPDPSAAPARFTVQPFKKGPDYIDPMWLSQAAGRSCLNLDYHTTPERRDPRVLCRSLAGRGSRPDRGQRRAVRQRRSAGRHSNAELAKLLGAPVVLVVDAQGMTRGVVPLLLGYQAFDPDLTIAGVILNKVGGDRHGNNLRRAVEHYTDLPVLGLVPRMPRSRISKSATWG